MLWVCLHYFAHPLLHQGFKVVPVEDSLWLHAYEVESKDRLQHIHNHYAAVRVMPKAVGNDDPSNYFEFRIGDLVKILLENLKMGVILDMRQHHSMYKCVLVHPVGFVLPLVPLLMALVLPP